ncbi:hypothetical protein G3I19_16840 [Streptomyces sp. SID10853]|uniref:hypothetical protein n=1 Tax=Streptomyces sp. SID10853 TaxID=2706028 RepID=UPI0013C02CDD|nr:hypothetical protein [Streptomyces sp. SID10853]NDZ80155.1 hypothetical protein [Streptomyces sp. SID10853]
MNTGLLRTTAAPAEPALRPVAQRGPGLELCYRSRLFLDRGELVLRRRSGDRRFAVGGTDGIARAVFVDAVGPDLAGRMGSPLPGSWGRIQFQNGDGRLIGYLDLDDWLPESGELPKGAVSGEQLLARTGMSALLTAAGIALHTVRDQSDPSVASTDSSRSGLSMGPGSSFPYWYWGVRLAAGAVWFATFTVILFSGSRAPWPILVSAVAAVLAPVARLVLRLWTCVRMRRYSPGVQAKISPHPSGDATIRFRRDTELRVQDRDLVLRDLSGQEIWLPRGGPHRVASLVRILDHTGHPLGAELRGSDGQVRAVLPWGPWFGGRGGGSAWSELQRAAGLTAGDHRLSRRASWPKKFFAAGLGVLPPTAAEARRVSRFPGTIAGMSSTAFIIISSLIAVAQGVWISDTHPTAGDTAALLGALGCFLQAAPYVVHQLDSRLRLDRPVRSEKGAS